MLDNETKRRIDTARDILVGKLPDPKSQVEQITIALIYKFMDDMDAQSVEFGGEPSFFVGDYEKFGWRKIFAPNIGGHELLALYGEAITSLNQNPNLPQLFRDVFKNAFLPYRDPETLKMFLKNINEFKYDHSERLGDAFEYLLSVLGSQGDAGQFRTPRHIIDFIVETLAPKKDETICDPACGTAGFLISSFKHILKSNTKHHNGDLLSPDDRRRLMQNFVGYDISPDMVRLSLVNLYLHGFPDPHIYEYDTLTSEDRWNEHFDIVMANPPFMSPKGGIKPHKKFSINANRSEVLFVDYIAEHIHPTSGRAGIIVPEGIIFQSAGAYKDLRKMLVDKNYLYAVVSLPAGVFQPYSGVKTSVLLMDKTIAAKTDKILFIKIQNDGFGLGAQRREMATSDLPDALNIIKEFQAAVLQGDTSRFLSEPPALAGGLNSNDSNVNAQPSAYADGSDLQAVAVEKTQIAANGDYNLSADRYKNALIRQHQFEMIELENLFNEIRNGKNVEQFDDVGKYRVTRIQTIADGTVNLDKTKWTNDEVSEDYFMQEGDILLSHINSFDHLAKTAIFKEKNGKVVHGINLIKFRPNKQKVIPEFVASVFKSAQFINLAKNFAQKAVNQASIKTSDLKSIKIPLPPLSIQKEIVEKIEGFQRIIDGAKQVVENYKPQIDISPDWEMVELGELGELKNGINYTKESTGEFVQVLGVKDFKSHFYAPLDSFATIQLDGKISDDYLLKENDIAFVRSNGNPDLIGRNVVIPKLDFKATFSGFTIRLRISSPKVFPLFYAHLLKTDAVRKMLTDSGTGANIRSLNQTSLKELTLPLPPLEVQQEIVARIEREQSLVNSNKELITIFEANIKDEINKLWEQ